MSSGIGEKPLSYYSRLAGISLLVVGAVGVFSNLFVMGGLIVWDDATTTANNVAANDLLFRFGVLGFIIMSLLDLVIAWAFYVLLRKVNKNVALLATMFRVVYTAIFSAALFNFLSMSHLLSDNNNLVGIEQNQINFEVMKFINALNNAGSISLVFFGVHLLLLGYLIFKSGFIPKIFGILMLLAGLAYFIDNVAWVLLSDYADLMAFFPLIVLVLTVIAELAFALWLLIKGTKVFESMS